MQLVETALFSRQIAEAMNAETYRTLQLTLAARPDAGALIRGGGGLRKLRWMAEGRGKRGGTRIIYYHATVAGTILLLFVYPKNERGDLSRSQLAQLREIVAREYP